jgi:hypothetical protein
MPLLYDKWQVGIPPSFQASERNGDLLFQKPGATVTVRRFGDGLRPSKQEGINLVKAAANPRHVTLFEKDNGVVYEWAFKHAEELEAPSPNRYLIEAHYVVAGEGLTIVAECQAPDDAQWADGMVRRVRFLSDWRVHRSVTVTVLGDRFVVTSHSRRDDGMWTGNGFQRLLLANEGPAALGKLVRRALGRCRRGVKTRRSSRQLAEDEAAFLRLAGVSRGYDISCWAHVVYVHVEDGVVKVMPTWAGRGYAHVEAWFLPMDPLRLPLECSPEELGQAMLTAKGLCTE